MAKKSTENKGSASASAKSVGSITLPVLSEKRKKALSEGFAKGKVAVSAVIYAVMVFVVIYGISADVYAGFPAPVPYIIIAIFLFMAFVRMYQSLVGGIPEKKQKKAAVKDGVASSKKEKGQAK